MDEFDRLIYKREMAEESLTGEIAAARRHARMEAGLPSNPPPARRQPSPVPRGWENHAREWHELNDDPEAYEF